MADQKAFTGRARDRTTRKSVIVADILSKIFITTGGIGTIIAVLGVCVFLVWVVVPLFQSSRIEHQATLSGGGLADLPLHVAVDEYQSMSWILLPDGRIQIFHLEKGDVLHEEQLFADRRITAASFLGRRPEAMFGFSNGTIDLFKIYFQTTFLEPGEVPEAIQKELRDGQAGTAVPLGRGVVQLTPKGQYRHHRLQVEQMTSERISETPIHLMDFVIRPSGPLICLITGVSEHPELKALSGREKENFMTGKKSFIFEAPVDLPLEAHKADFPKYLEVSGAGSDVYAAWEDGWLQRIRCDDLDSAFVAEKGRLIEHGRKLTAMAFTLGDSTLVWGDSDGQVRGGFTIRDTGLPYIGLYDVVRDKMKGQYAFAITKELAHTSSEMLCMAPSSHSRLILCGFADSTVRIFNVTHAGDLGSIRVPSEEQVVKLNVSPKEDGFIAFTPTRAYHYNLDPLHPEANFASLFGRVWYEGYTESQHMWQSSSATDDSEPKFGLIPLIFGTIKATLYAMLFGAPLALFAAIYTSEFLQPKAKAVIKPTIELMASLPSVVLGFLAALVFAPFVEKVVPGTLIIFLTVPFSFLLCAYIWQLLPVTFTRRAAHWRLLFYAVPMAVGVLLSAFLGPMLENFLFAGDIKNWLAWQPDSGDAGQAVYRSAFGGWFLLFLPFCALFMVFLVSRVVTPWLRRLTEKMARTPLAWVELLKFSTITVSTLLLSSAVAFAFSRMGMDPRADWIFWSFDFSPIDIYVQRNALIVGFVMGFAVIPIIYTIAEDALSAVPQHLRSASLGSGATPWQTAVRIIIPTAMSGLFSALMIGLGRAVGETMIVLMALGNTPIMDWNLFNGARTLSANIAVEMPEAVRNSTHYRTLFLAALVLFAMTFVVNTIAELVRLRFRKRAYQL